IAHQTLNTIRVSNEPLRAGAGPPADLRLTRLEWTSDSAMPSGVPITSAASSTVARAAAQRGKTVRQATFCRKQSGATQSAAKKAPASMISPQEATV
ncbi:MAG TPA: hypothetical protein VKP30_04230, partial [Polyangiaceae bacterium]|nr:hypothetical protein [Polyangiaceae bacterium]